ncbi:hypothetical protein CCMA1212_004086 [Trichoderma ghanense]|uniref:Enoyl reductase (ER) domain-containing protein n=1 Tax=Trichoderma ghanense TaxID=65468 RepID=A0ABY2H9H8_9HYPO
MDLNGQDPNNNTDVTPSSSRSTKANPQTRFRKGDKVMALLPASHALPTGTGALAEHVAIPARFAAHKPASAPFSDAAGCLLTGMTAHQLVQSGVQPGDGVLVNAASGGIGTLVGLVVGICSGRNAQMVERLGADEVVDYTLHQHNSNNNNNNNNNNKLPAHLATLFQTTPFNAITDTLGHQSLYAHSPAYLLPAGTYASVGTKPPDFSLPNFLRAICQMNAQRVVAVIPLARRRRASLAGCPSLEDRQRIADLLGKGHVRVVRDSVWRFEDAREAYARLAGCMRAARYW